MKTSTYSKLKKILPTCCKSKLPTKSILVLIASSPFILVKFDGSAHRCRTSFSVSQAKSPQEINIPSLPCLICIWERSYVLLSCWILTQVFIGWTKYNIININLYNKQVIFICFCKIVVSTSPIENYCWQMIITHILSSLFLKTSLFSIIRWSCGIGTSFHTLFSFKFI